MAASKIFTIILAFLYCMLVVQSLSIISTNPSIGNKDVRYNTKNITFTFDGAVKGGWGYVYLMIKGTGNTYSAFLSTPTFAGNAITMVTTNGNTTVTITYTQSPFLTYSSTFYVQIDSGAFVNAVSNAPYPGLFGNSTSPSSWYFQVDPPPDRVVPVLVSNNSLSPPDTISQFRPIGVPIGTNSFSMNFTKVMAAENGTIKLIEYITSNVISSISSSSSFVNMTGNVVSFSFPNIQLKYQTWYMIDVSSTAFSDCSGLGYPRCADSNPRADESPNYFAGLTAKWHFLIENQPPTFPPTLINMTDWVPTPGSLIPLEYTYFEFLVDQAVYPSSLGRIMIFQGDGSLAENGTNVFTYRGNDPNIHFSFIENFSGLVIGTRCTFSITPTTFETNSQNYYVLFETGAFVDMYNNSLVQMFDGYTWNFTTVPAPDLTPPVIEEALPPNGDSTIPVVDSWEIYLLFDKNVYLNNSTANLPAVTFINFNTQTISQTLNFSYIEIKGMEVFITVPPYSLPLYATSYTINLPPNLFTDVHGNDATAIPSLNLYVTGYNFSILFPANSWAVQTVLPPDTTPPYVLSFSPENQVLPVLSVPIPPLVLVFNKPVYLGPGLIQIVAVQGVSSRKIVCQTIANSVTSWVSVNDNSTTFVPPVLLNGYDTIYSVIIEPNALVDVWLNSFPGFYDATQWTLYLQNGGWSFKTELEPQVIISTTSVTVAEAVFNATYTIKLTAAPYRDVNINIITSGITKTSPLDGKVYLSGAQVNTHMATFTSTNWQTPQVVTVFAYYTHYSTKTTTYDTIIHAVTTLDTQYVGRVVPVIQVTILETDQTSPPPSFISAQMTNDLSSIVVTFSTSTNAAGLVGIFPCYKLFLNTGVSLASSLTYSYLGLNPQCYFDSAQFSFVTIVLDVGATILPNYPVTLLGGLLKGTNTALYASVLQSQYMLPPIIPNPVVLTLSGPSSIGKCDSLSISASATGSGGRSITYYWSVSQASITLGFVPTTQQVNNWISVQTIINNANKGSGQMNIIIAGALLDSEYFYTFICGAANFLGTSSSPVSLVVKKDPMAKPTLSIDGGGGGQLRSVYRNQLITLLGSTSALSCDGTSIPDNMLITQWSQVFTNNNHANAISLVRSANSRTVTIPAFTLALNTNYTFKFTSTFQENTLIFNSDTLSYTIIPQNVKIFITGGLGNSFSVNGMEAFTIDASSSYDPDQLPLPWYWNWVCSTLDAKGVPMTCKDNTDQALPIPPFSNTSNVLIIPPAYLQLDNLYTFTLTAGKSQTNYGVASIQMLYKSGRSPSISMTLSQQNYRIGYKINPSLKVSITSAVQSKFPKTLELAWSQVKGDINMNDTAVILTPLNGLNLVVQANSLTPGNSYTFKLAASDVNNVGFSTLTFLVNKPPSSGSLMVTPSVGYVMQDIFRFVALNWVDDPADFPLTYIFGTQLGTDFPQILSYKQLDVSFSSTLPLGSGANFNVSCFVTVTDNYGAGTTVFSAPVSVVQHIYTAPQKLNYVTNLLTQTLSSTTISGDSTTILKNVNNIVSILPSSSGSTYLSKCDNTIDCHGKGVCTPLPAGNCASGQICYYCVCNSNYYGPGCNIDSATYLQTAQIRNGLLQATASAMKISNFSPEAVQQQAAAVSLVTAASAQLDGPTMLFALNITSNITKNAISNLPSGTSDVIGSTLSSLIDGGVLQVSNNSFTSIDNTLTALAQGMVQYSVSGEAQSNLTTNNFKLAASKQTVDSLSSIALPQSDSEVANGLPQTSFSFPPNAMNGSGLVSLKSVKWSINPYGTYVAGSLVTSLQLTHDNGTELAVKDLNDPIEIILPRDGFILNGPTESELMRLIICNDSYIGNITVSPPCDGGAELVGTCNGVSDELKMYCPPSRTVPSCTFWDESSLSWDSTGCWVYNFTDTLTICHCTHLTSFATNLELTFSDAGETLESVKHLTPAAILQSFNIIFSILGLYALVIGICYWGNRQDLRDECDKKLRNAHKYQKILNPKIDFKQENIFTELDEVDNRMHGLKHACFDCSGTGVVNSDKSDSNSPLLDCPACFGSSLEYACSHCQGSGFQVLHQKERAEVKKLAKIKQDSQKALLALTTKKSLSSKENDSNPPDSPSAAKVPTSFWNERRISTIDQNAIIEGVSGFKPCLDCRGTGRTNTCYFCLGSGEDALLLEPCHECLGTGNRSPMIVRLLRKFWHYFKRLHPWFSIYFCHEEYYTRSQRITVLLCTVMGHMFANSFLYRMTMASKSGDPIQNEEYSISIGIITAIIVFPITSIFVILFKRTQAAKNTTLKLAEKELFEARNKKAEDILTISKLKKQAKELTGSCNQTPYVVAYINNLFVVEKIKTSPLVDGGDAPEFTEMEDNHLEVDFPGFDDPTVVPTLRVEVWDYDKWKPSELLGIVDIEIFHHLEKASIDAKEEGWYNLVDHHGLPRGRIYLEIWFELDEEELQINVFPEWIPTSEHPKIDVFQGIKDVERILHRRSNASLSEEKRKIVDQKLINRKMFRRLLQRKINLQRRKINEFLHWKKETYVKLTQNVSDKFDELKRIVEGRKLAKSTLIDNRQSKLKTFQKLKTKGVILGRVGTLHCVVTKVEGLMEMDTKIKNIVFSDLLSNADSKFRNFVKAKKFEFNEKRKKALSNINELIDEATQGLSGISKMIARYKLKKKHLEILKNKEKKDKRAEFLEQFNEVTRNKILEVEVQVAKMPAFKRFLFKQFIFAEPEEAPKPLPVWIDKLVYLLAAVYCLFAGLFIVLFSIEHQGTNLANSWLESLAVSQISAAIVGSPITLFIKQAILPVLVVYYIKVQALDIQKIQNLMSAERQNFGSNVNNILTAKRIGNKLIGKSEGIRDIRRLRKEETDRIEAMQHKKWVKVKKYSEYEKEDVFRAGNFKSFVSKTVWRKNVKENPGMSNNEIVNLLSKKKEDATDKPKEEVKKSNSKEGEDKEKPTNTSNAMDLGNEVHVAKEDEKVLNKTKATDFLFNIDKKVQDAEVERMKHIHKPQMKQIDVQVKAKMLKDPLSAMREAEKMIEEQLALITYNAQMEEMQASVTAEARELKDMVEEEILARSANDQFYGVERADEVAERKRRVKAREMRTQQMDLVKTKQNELARLLKEQEENRNSRIELDLMSKEEKLQCSKGDKFFGIDAFLKTTEMSSEIAQNWAKEKEKKREAANELIKKKIGRKGLI